MEQKRKITIFILTILVLIVFAYVLKQGKKTVPTPGITSTWETFEYKGKEFPFPPDFTYTEIMGGKNNKDVVAVKVSSKISDEVSVFVGGGKGCEELPKPKLCLGKDPVYTNSQDPEAMQLFEMYVRINENPQ